MTDQELVLATLRQVGSIIAEHLEATTSEADEVVAQLVAVLDTQELADAIKRLERGYGLRVVKQRAAGRLTGGTELSPLPRVLLCMSVKKRDFGFYMCVCGCLLAAVIEVSAFVSGTSRTRVAQAQITNSAQAY